MKFYTNVVQWGDHILLRGYENDRPILRKVQYQPTLFLPGETGPWRSIHGKVVEPIHFDSIKEAKEFSKRYEDVANFQVQGLTRYLYTFLNEEYTGEVQFDRDLILVANIDIEVETKEGFPSVEKAANAITAITLKKNNIYYVFGCGKYETNRTDVKYRKCRDERELLMAFLDEWCRKYPDVITGWNIAFFDIPYIVRRIEVLIGEQEAKRLSPWKIVTEHKVFVMNRENTVITIAGVATLDYLEMYRKFTYTPQDSYKLDNIAKIELDEQKLDYSEYENLQDLYERNFQKYIDYNIHDVELVDKLDDKMKLIDMVFTLAYDAKVNYADVFSQVRMWDILIHNHLWNKKIVTPAAKAFKSKTEAYEGAYVKSPMIGAHDWVLSFDLNSLYPHLIMQYNISPETISEHYTQIDLNDFLDKNIQLPIIDGHSLAPNGWHFSNAKQGFLGEMMQHMYDDRVRYKTKMIEAQKAYEGANDKNEKKVQSKLISRYKNMQMAKKIQLNSAYGAIGNEYFRFFDIRQATAITIGGQLAIRWAENEINKYMNNVMGTNNVDYIIASDTDSLYINFGPLVAQVYKNNNHVSTDKIVQFLDDISSQKLEPFIDKIYQVLAERTNSFAQKMNMKREVIANRGIWTAKKRYILNVFDSEGVRYKEPKLKIMGIESVKSSTPSACRDAIKNSLSIIMTSTEDNLHTYIQSFREKFNKMSFDDIAFPRGAQALDDYVATDKSIPIHIRGAMAYNKYLTTMNVTKKYEFIRGGEKIKFCYLKMPNKLNENVISAPSTLPKEFALDSYIDYNTQFEKSFLQPLRTILNVIHWTDEKRNTLEEFFSSSANDDILVA